MKRFLILKIEVSLINNINLIGRFKEECPDWLMGSAKKYPDWLMGSAKKYPDWLMGSAKKCSDWLMQRSEERLLLDYSQGYLQFGA